MSNEESHGEEVPAESAETSESPAAETAPPPTSAMPAAQPPDFAREQTLRKRYMVSTIVLGVIVLIMLTFDVAGGWHSHQKKQIVRPGIIGRGSFGGPGAFGGNGGGGFGGGAGQGGGSRFGGNLKSRFFNSDGSVNQTAVNDFVNALPSANRSQVVSRFEYIIDQAVSAGTITSDEGTKLHAAFESAAGSSTTATTATS